MPKIRIKRVTESYLQQFATKSYNTVNGITTFTTSGALNTNFKKFLSEKHNAAGKYFKVEQISKTGELTEESDFFDDSSTIEFIESTKNNRLLNVPVVKIENSNDYYITSDPNLLSATEITETQAKHKNLKVSDRLISTPNFIDLDEFSKTSMPTTKSIDKLREKLKEDIFKPFVEEDIFSGASDSFINESIVYKNEEYHLGDQQRIEIELDFTESSDAYLLNTQLFYRSNNFYSNLANDEPANFPDDVFITDQVNLISNVNKQKSITSHFLPNAIWSNKNKRWEYNVIEEEINPKLNPYLYNKLLSESLSLNTYDFPSLITHSHNFATPPQSDSIVNENIFKHLNYMTASPIAFSASYDGLGSLDKEKDDSYIYNTPVKSYGFPNSSLWKTTEDQSIKMTKYLNGDFLLEKVIFEGCVDVDAEFPSLKGNFVNHHQNYTGHPVFSALSPFDAQLFENDTEFNQEHILNSNLNDYISTGINFYLINKKESDINNFVPEINGHVYSRESKVEKFSDYVLPANDSTNPYIDISLSDIKEIDKLYFHKGNFKKISYTDEKELKYEPIKASANIFVKKDSFENVTSDRLESKFYYLDNADLGSIDLLTKNYFSIKEGQINSTTKIYNTLASNTITKEIKEAQSSIETKVTNELITHNSIAFINRNNSNIQIDLEKLNADLVVSTEVDNKNSISYTDYEFKISNNIKKNSSRNTKIGESNFKVTSNYRYQSGSDLINIDDDINIIEESLKETSDREIYKVEEKSESLRDITSESGYVLSKNEPNFSREKIGYLLKKTDDLAVGINSFPGFNNIISYLRLKNKLKIVLVGREVHKKAENESFYSKSIKKSFSGNQNFDLLQKKDKRGKYFKKNMTNNNEYLSDSVYPNTVEIFFDLANKQFEESYEKDSLDWFLSVNDYSNDGIVPETTNKIVFSNKNISGSKYNNIISDWHNTYYLSKYKDNDVVSNKQIKNSLAIARERSNVDKTYLYYDTNSYSLNYKYDIASDFRYNVSNNTTSMLTLYNSNITSSIRKILLPFEHEQSSYLILPGFPTPTVSFTESIYRHSGIDFIRDKSNSSPYELTKDSLIFRNNGDNIFNIIIDSGESGASIQYLKIPTKVSNLFENEKYSVASNTGPFKNEWAIVIEDPTFMQDSNFKEKLDLFRSATYSDKISYKKTILDGDITYEIVYDDTFKITANFSKGSKIYTHDFYVIYKNEENVQEKIFIILPLQHVKTQSNAGLTVDTGNDIFYNEYYDINFFAGTPFNFDKSDFRITDYTYYPKTYDELFNNVDPADNFRANYNFSNYDQFLGPQNISFYYLKNEIKNLYRSNTNHSDPVFDNIDDMTLSKNLTTNTLYSVDNISKFNLVDKKHFSVDSSYYDILDKVINEINKKSIFLNKILSEGYVYKKINKNFVKTKNKVLYEVVNFVSYRNNSTGNGENINRTFMNIIGLTNRKGEYVEGDLSCMIMYDIDSNDIIRIYDEKISDYNKKYKMSLDVPYIEIDLSVTNPLFDSNNNISSIAIKYSHYATNNFDDIPEDTAALKSYGSPISRVDDIENANRFIYSYSRNKKYSFPIDQTSGYRYGVHSPNPVNTSYTFNTNHYGQFKDRSYDTQNYSVVKYVNDKLVESHCVEKKYVDDTFTVITATEAAARPLFAGSNVDNYDRVYHPYIESKDGSDMSYLYT